ncbi:hypothetical protein G7048_19510 [Diaphorobacter sp. HDW4B]|uniref:hypothetical protein n=1 Tax=Diaphorobacter sp. HDW4B TaxID=2714925 RepID=UPI0014080B19|nr:hypothetical protein [Diaphorobacter sp. HDW4B]QIL72350.1 hypothetical protein G7048_19510 [Diaphorobacter sp. HDW4B]
MNACTSLAIEVAKFRKWADLYPIHQRSGEWECDYDQWPLLWGAAIAVLNSLAPSEWTDECCANLLYAIARDNEVEYIADELAGKPDAVFKLARLAVDSTESDAKWQLAEHLGILSSGRDEAERLLLIFIDDKDEYVSRRSLIALGALKSIHAEALAERAWLTGHQYQRIAALWVLKDVAPSKLKQYAQMAMLDGRSIVVQNAHEVLVALELGK